MKSSLAVFTLWSAFLFWQQFFFFLSLSSSPHHSMSETELSCSWYQMVGLIVVSREVKVKGFCIGILFP